MKAIVRPLAAFLAGILLTTALGGFPAGALAAAHVTPGRDWDEPHVANQLLVKLPPGGARVLPDGHVVLREIPELGLALVQVSRARSLAGAAAQLAEQVGVEWVEPNYTIHLDAAPNDPAYATNQLPYLRRIGAEKAWDYTEGRAETIIAVLDTGIDMEHEDLEGAIWTNEAEAKGREKVDDDGNGFVDDVHGWDFASGDNNPSDDHGHGTHVAGIAAARIGNGKGIAGLAGRSTIMPVDVFQGGIGTYEALIRAIIYATDNGARVINLSLGASSYSKGEEAAVDYAYSHGVVVVAAAGNTGREEYHYPATHRHAIAVAATTADDFLSSFSTRGEWVDVAAPGSSIYSTFPRNGYGLLSGTSMATPHVSGLAALILSRNPGLLPDQVRAIIESTAEDLGSPGRDIYFGMGRIDAGRAVAAVTPGDEPPPGYPPDSSLDVDLPGCTELVANGGFEAGLASWETRGAVEVVTSPTSTGSRSLHFVGGTSALGVVTQTITIEPGTIAALLRFDYRIDPKDYGRGSGPAWPFDDWLTATWWAHDGTPLGELLRTGNTADTVQGGLSWDDYVYRLPPADLAALAREGQVRLVFTSKNDSDAYPTDVWLDALSLCVIRSSPPARTYVPLIRN